MNKKCFLCKQTGKVLVHGLTHTQQRHKKKSSQCIKKACKECWINFWKTTADGRCPLCNSATMSRKSAVVLDNLVGSHYRDIAYEAYRLARQRSETPSTFLHRAANEVVEAAAVKSEIIRSTKQLDSEKQSIITCRDVLTVCLLLSLLFIISIIAAWTCVVLLMHLVALF